ncbi:MAG: hypothetical protein Q4F28_13850 [Eubacteriales bacterium]|nr:hypothetical protein [Eubacteriales bacterium]
MSVFSETLKSEIRKSGKTLLQLSDASGLSLDHISKMRLGKRLAKDERKVKLLFAALECPEEKRHELYSLYKMEKVGEHEWNCLLELKKLLEYERRADKMQNSPFQPDEDRLKQVTVLANIEEIQMFFLQVMHYQCMMAGNQPSHLFMMAGEIPDILVEVLARWLEQCPLTCEHYFYLRRNIAAEDSLYNIRFINRIMPLIQASDRYVPCYDYMQIGELPFTNWFVGDQWAMAVDWDTGIGIVLWDQEQISYLQQMMRRKVDKKRRLLKWYQDAAECLEELCSSRDLLSDSRSGGLEEEVRKSYYLEYTPCLLFLIPPQIIEQHLLVTGEQKEKLLAILEKRIHQLKEEDMVHFFTLEGVRRFAEEGRLSGIPDEVYRPVELEMRREILQNYLKWMEAEDSKYYVIDGCQMKLPMHTSLYSTALLPTTGSASACRWEIIITARSMRWECLSGSSHLCSCWRKASSSAAER